jgi:hypothetical protein
VNKNIDTAKMTKAWDYLAKAILLEIANEMSKARMALVMACNLELQALGFESTAMDMGRTITLWDRPSYLGAVAA